VIRSAKREEKMNKKNTKYKNIFIFSYQQGFIVDHVMMGMAILMTGLPAQAGRLCEKKLVMDSSRSDLFSDFKVRPFPVHTQEN